MKPEDITAWALNELSPEERAHIEAELTATPQARQKARETQAFCALLSEHLVDEEAAFRPEQRERLQALELPAPENVVPFATATETPRMNGKAFHAKATAAREQAQPKPSAWMRLAALAACLMFALFVIHQSRNTKSAVAVVQTAANGSPEKAVTMTLGRDEASLRSAAKPAPPMPPAAPMLAMRKDAILSLDAPGPVSFAKAGAAAKPVEDLLAESKTASPPSSAPAAAEAMTKAGTGTLTLSGANTYGGGVTIANGGTLALGDSPAATPADPLKSKASSPAVAQATRAAGLSPGNANTAIYKKIKDTDPTGSGRVTTTATPEQLKAEATAAPSSRYDQAARDHVRARMLAQVDEAWEDEGAQQHLRRQRQDSFATKAAPVPGTERYTRIVENAFQTVQSQPLSTFSIDVDTASYANVRRFLNAGRLPPPDAVRLEELINYFPYDYEQPGKDQPFSVQVDLAEAPWAPQHRLARVAIKGRDVGQERPAANFVFLVDVSGSMDSPERLPLVKQCLQLLTEQLRDDDHVSIVTYAGDCRVALESTSGKEKDWIMEIINDLHAGGSTNGESGITMAYNQAGAHFVKDGINRIILCTDGDFNVGISDADQLQQLIKQKAKGGTFLSVLGFGTDNLQDRTMEVLADNGNGNYAYIDSLAEARKVMVEQMHGTLITIAKDVKIQVEFNPAIVASYRLIGYEKRLLATKDFNNDKQDAGEVGAGHTITALYELVPAGLPLPNGALSEVDKLKYQPQDKDKALPTLGAKPPEHLMEGINDETMTVKLRYKAPDGQLSKLIEVPVRDARKTLQDSPRDFRFATAVASFGMLLRDSEHVEDFRFESVRKLALSGKGEDALGYRGEFIQLIDKAKGLKMR